jgi:hypothetical protein
MGAKRINIGFPLGGFNAAGAYRQQPPYTSRDLMNVRPRDVFERRMRGGSRPGLVAAITGQQELNGGEPIRLLSEVSWAEAHGGDMFEDTPTSTTKSAEWEDDLANAATLLLDDDLNYYAEKNVTRGGVLARYGNSYYDDDGDYLVPSESLYLYLPNPQEGGTYSIWLNMTDSAPHLATQGARLDYIVDDGEGVSYTMKIRLYKSGNHKQTVTSDPYAVPEGASWLRGQMFYDTGTGNICFMIRLLNDPTQLGAGGILDYWGSFAASANVDLGHRIGFSIRGQGATGARVHVGGSGGPAIRSGFRSPDYVKRQSIVVAAGDTLYSEKTPGQLMENAAGDALVTGDRQLHAAQYGGKLYIADHGNICVNGTDGVIDATGLELDAASVSDWTALGISEYTHVVRITGATGNVVNGIYRIDSVAAGAVTLSDNAGVGGGTCVYSIEPSLKVFDPATDDLSHMVATVGTVPTNCPCIARFRGRIVVAGPDHQWYMSRQFAPTDWSYDTDFEDAQRAVSATNSEAGVPGEDVRAIMYYEDDYLLFGCAHSIWLLRGDPALAGASLDPLSESCGVLSQGAWCAGPSGEIIFLSYDGLYMVNRGGSAPMRLSQTPVPVELSGIDPATTDISLIYDQQFEGLHVFLTPQRTQAAARHWWVDWATKSFCPAKLPVTMEPHVVMAHASQIPSDTGVLLGCRDSYLRRFDEGAGDDDGEIVASYAWLGPIPLAPDDFEGTLNEITGVLDEMSDAVDWTVYVALTPQDLFNQTTGHTNVWHILTHGAQFMELPRLAGAWAAVKISSEGQWALERITASVLMGGKARL